MSLRKGPFLFSLKSHVMRISPYSSFLAIAVGALGNLFATTEEGLIALWDFESGSLNSVSGAGTLPGGTFVGGSFTSSANDPIMGNYLELDNDGEYMAVANRPFFQNLSDGWSAAAWFRAARAPVGNEGFFVLATAGASPISVELLDGNAGLANLQILTDTVGGTNPSLTIEIPELEILDWNHVLVTYENGDEDNTLTVYLNGIRIDSVSFSEELVSTANGFNVGTNSTANGRWFEGDIDEASLWNRPLTLFEASSFQENIIVTTLMDESNGDANLSLREAIINAPNGGFIEFDPSLFDDGQNTITLTIDELFINKDLTITAANSPNGVIIDANQIARVMQISPSAANNNTANVSLDGLTFTGGFAPLTGFPPDDFGGGLFVDGSGSGTSVQVSLNNCTFFNNIAASIGGGICNSGFFGGDANMTLTNCTLYSNTATTFGGGIYNDGFLGSASVNLINCTLYRNTAFTRDGGGIYNDGQDGNAILSLNSSTLVDNSALAGGGILHTGNFNGTASLTLSNSILSNITASTGPDIQELGSEGTIVALDDNLLSSLNGQTSLTEGSSGTSGLIIADPLLSPFDNYGGPTQTVLPLLGSPAINAASSSISTMDQRGFAITDGAPDIGATEAPDWLNLTATELDSLFLTDFDGDGNVHGQEVLLGTDPFTHDLDNPNNFTPILGGRGVTFGRDQNFNYSYQIDVYRSFDLTPGSFERIFSYSAFDHTETAGSTNSDLTSDLTDPDLISLPDSTTEEKAFYQLRITND